MIEVLRWFGVLPAALLSGVTVFYGGVLFVDVQALIQKYMPMPGSRGFDIINFVFVVVILHIVLGAASVIAGVKTAPRCRRITATVLAPLWSVFYCGTMFTLPPGASNTFWDYLAYVVGVIGAFGAAVYIHIVEPEKGK